MFIAPDDRQKLYKALCRKTGPSLSTRPFVIEEICDPQKVAFTVLDKGASVHIYVNPTHPMFTRDPDESKLREILAGVILHEMLHTTYTEPLYCIKYATSLKYPKFYHTLCNIIEDETIEARACTVLLKNDLFCLHRAIYESWHTSKAIDASATTIEQVMSALIQFTDMGPLVPGSSLSDEAYDILSVVLPKVFSAIWETPRSRAKIALSVYMDLLPILERDLPDDEAVISHDKGQCAPSGVNGQADESKPDKDEMDSSASNRAKAKIAEAMSRAKKKKAASDEKGEPDEESGEPDGSNCVPADSESEASKEHSGKRNSSHRANHEEEDPSDDSDGQDTAISETDEDQPASGAETFEEDESEEDTSSEEEDDSSSADASSNEKDDCDSTDESGSHESSEDPSSRKDIKFDIPSELFDTSAIGVSVRELEADVTFDRIDISESVAGDAADHEPTDVKLGSSDEMREVKSLDIPALSKVFGPKISCRNAIMTGISSSTLESYQRVKRLYAPQIHSFSRRMKKIALEEESRSWEKRGSLHVGRLAETASTSVNIFQKKTQKDRRNGKILIMLDVSGSMGGRKITAARNALVCITEGLTGAGIPVKVITFHNDYTSGDTRVIHNHYINYKGQANKASLMTITAGGDNFDGYSIRYGVRDLLKERAEHTLMIIISDGQPACSYYKSIASGIADTKAAVIEAKRKTRVIGIGIDADLSVLRSFYKDTFVEMTDMSSLMTNLSRLIEKEVRSW